MQNNNSVETFGATTPSSNSVANTSGFSVDGLAALQNYLADFSKELDQTNQEQMIVVSSDDHVIDDCYPSTSNQILYVDEDGHPVSGTEIVVSAPDLENKTSVNGENKFNHGNHETLSISNPIPINQQPIILTLGQASSTSNVVISQPQAQHHQQQQPQSFLIPLNFSGANIGPGSTTILLPINSLVSSDGVIQLRVGAPTASASSNNGAGPILFFVNNSQNIIQQSNLSSDNINTLIIDNSGQVISSNLMSNGGSNASTKVAKPKRKRKDSQKRKSQIDFNKSGDSILSTDLLMINNDSRQKMMSNESDGVDDVIKRVVSGVDRDNNVANQDQDEEEQDEEDEDENEDTTKVKLLKTQDSLTFFQCQLCDYTNPKRYLMSRHLKSHSEERPHKCPVCERCFKTSNSLQNHINTHTGLRPHQCKMCEASFTTSGEMVRHIRYRHTLEKPHKCKHCDYASVELSKLKRHMRSHSGERPFQCPHCIYASPDTYKLKRHMRVHTGEKPYECDVCLQRFTQSNSLKAHKKIHSGEKPIYQCEFCPSSCGRKTDLKIHVKKLHANSGPPLTCKKCPKTFTDRYSYKIHLKTHERTVNPEQTHQCPNCSYCVTSLRQLNLHLNSEHVINADDQDSSALKFSERNMFVCSVCGLAFRNNSQLKRHKNEYHPNKEKLYGCSYCQKRFTFQTSLLKHVESHQKFSNKNPVSLKYVPVKHVTTGISLDKEDDTDSAEEVENDNVNCTKTGDVYRQNLHNFSHTLQQTRKLRRKRIKPEQLGFTNVRRRGRIPNRTICIPVQTSPKKPLRSFGSPSKAEKEKEVENLFGFALPSSPTVIVENYDQSYSMELVSAPGISNAINSDTLPETSMEPLLVINDKDATSPSNLEPIVHVSTPVITNFGNVDNQISSDNVGINKDDNMQIFSTKDMVDYDLSTSGNSDVNMFGLTDEERLEIVTLAKTGSSNNESNSASTSV